MPIWHNVLYLNYWISYSIVQTQKIYKYLHTSKIKIITLFYEDIMLKYLQYQFYSINVHQNFTYNSDTPYS